MAPAAHGRFGGGDLPDAPPGLTEEKRIAAQRIARNVIERVETLRALGLGYLSLERSTPSLSPGELQRLRLATQIRSNLFGVVYVLDEPSAGLHPADTEALITALDQLKRAGNSLFVVEHDLDLMRHADWIVDVGPDAGSHGGRVLYSGPPPGLRGAEGSHTARYLFGHRTLRHEPRTPHGWLRLSEVRRNNLEKRRRRLSCGRTHCSYRCLGIREVESRESSLGRARGGAAGARACCAADEKTISRSPP